MFQIAFSGNGSLHFFTNESIFILKDLDTSVILDSRSWEWNVDNGGWMDDILPYCGSYAVIPGHTYLMTIRAYSSYSDAYYGIAHLEADVTPRPNRIYVDDNAFNDPGIGTQSYPFKRIQDAINYSIDGDTIQVAEGTYLENISINGKNIELTSIDPNDSTVVGATIIDGQQLGSVITITDSSPIISGFTIKNGYAEFGGGLNIENSSIEIRNCYINRNSTRNINRWDSTETGSGSGGGIYLSNSVATIFNSTISYNSTGGANYGYPPGTGSGGGILSANSDLSIVYCKINNNATANGGYRYPGGNAGNGGGISATGGSLMISDSDIFNNDTGNGGIGVDSLENGGDGGDGGGIYCTGTLTLTQSIIHNNLTGNGGYGGWECGLYYCPHGGDGGNGGGVCCGSGIIANCTFVNNQTGEYGCAYTCGAAGNGGAVSGSAVLKNCIIWDNEAEQIAGVPGVTYSDIQGGFTGINNIDADLLFADLNNGDFHLKSEYGRWNPNSQSWVYDIVTSPCIDAGDPAEPNWTNELWPHGKRINIGAYGGTPQASMSPSEAGNIADISRNDCVGMEDLMLFVENWLVQDVLLAEDMDLDNQVNLNDFTILAENWSYCLGGDLVSWWKFDETSGIQAHDSSLYGNHGTLVNGPVWTGDGNLSFDGVDDYVSVPDSTSLEIQNSLTISVWVKLESYGPSWSWPKVVIKPHTEYVEPFEMFTVDLGPHGTFPRFIITDGIADGQYACVYDATKTLNLDQWYHIIGTYDGSTVALYLNGQLIASGPSAISIGQNTMPVCIGSSRGNYCFKGLIDEVQIYHRGLTAGEVENLYQNH
jgi:hypothetical protein